MPDPSPTPNPKSPGEKGIYQYLPIECPNCGFQGKVKISRLNQTFHCKQCNQVFHVTRDGTVGGERPAEAPPVETAPPVVDEPTWVEQRFAKLPAGAKWGVVGVLALVVVYGLMKLFGPSEPLPTELDARAELAASSFGRGDWSTLKRLALGGTQRKLGQWYDKNRPDEWNDVVPEEIQSKVVEFKKKLKRYEKSEPIMDVVTTARIGGAGQTSYDVPFIWTQNEYKEWELDGEQMVKLMKPRKSKVATKAATEEGAGGDEPEGGEATGNIDAANPVEAGNEGANSTQ
ncbi:MAG TPA: hypothetical protein VG826_25010 [Pirellulales bacterium]|nr:hypothetical protein [Pirellulales bacterium]